MQRDQLSDSARGPFFATRQAPSASLRAFLFSKGQPPPTWTDLAARPVVRSSALPILRVQSARAKFHTTGVRVSRPGLLGTSRPLTCGVAAETCFTRGRFVTGLALLTTCPGKPQGFPIQKRRPPLRVQTSEPLGHPAPSKPQGFSSQKVQPPPTTTDWAARPVVRFSARPILLVQSRRANSAPRAVEFRAPSSWVLRGL